jgi:hypothetical protein
MREFLIMEQVHIALTVVAIGLELRALVSIGHFGRKRHIDQDVCDVHRGTSIRKHRQTSTVKIINGSGGDQGSGA